MLLLLTPRVKATSIDSLGRAFDNCVFLHDSLVHELKQAKGLSLLDSANVIEHRTYIGVLERQIIELDAQKQAMQSIVDKQSKNYKSLQKSAKKELRKSKIKTWIIAPASAVGGFVVGFVIGKFLY